MKLFKFLIIFGSLFVISCQTNMVKEFDSLKVGNDKHQVIDKLGSPRHMTRMNGEDRWYYMYYNDDVRLQKEVHFKDGLVIYFGDKKAPTPELLPEAIDAKNDRISKEAELENQMKAEASKNAYLDYLKFEKKIKKQDRVEYLPDFEPVE
jgi:outer membrane protein assembly factor BamE